MGVAKNPKRQPSSPPARQNKTGSGLDFVTTKEAICSTIKTKQVNSKVKGTFFFSIAVQVERIVIIKIMLEEPVRLTGEKQLPRIPVEKVETTIIMKKSLLPQFVSKVGPKRRIKTVEKSNCDKFEEPKTQVNNLIQCRIFLAEKASAVPCLVGQEKRMKSSFARKERKAKAKNDRKQKVREIGALYSSFNPLDFLDFEEDFFLGF